MFPLVEKQNQLIVKLYELHSTKGPRVNIYELEKLVGFERVEFYKLVRQLGMSRRQWLRKENEVVYITPEGENQAISLMEESYSQKKKRVLETIRAMSGDSRFVVFPELAQRMEISERELAVLCTGLDEQGYVNFPGGDFVEMKDAGYEALEPQKPSGSTINYMNIEHNYGAAAQGSNFVQNVQINPEFDKAVASIVDVVRSAPVEETDKEELYDEIEKVKALAIREPSSGLLTKIKSRLEVLKVGLESVSLLDATKPYLEAIWTYFKRKYNL